jgi:hypothetical protein
MQQEYTQDHTKDKPRQGTTEQEHGGDKKDALADLANHAAEYATSFYKLQVLNLTQKATDVTANIAGGIISAFLGIFVLFFGGVALAFWLGDMINSRAGGFLIVAAFFALLAFIFMGIRKKVVFPMFINKIILKFYE